MFNHIDPQLMTKKLYWESNSTHSNVEVLACERQENGRYALRLDQTPFHPKGGGQPSDNGWIGDIAIQNVVLIEGDIIHYADREIKIGPTVAKVDAVKRYKHSKLHSAGHLIGHAMERLNWIPVKAHHWPGEAHVIFNPPDSTSQMSTDDIQRMCDTFIAQDLSCHSRLIDNRFREIRFGHLPPYGCGGTHVESTGELKGLKILSSALKKGKLIVSYEI